jgi:hypothetical protein
MKQSSLVLKALVPDAEGNMDMDGFKFGAERYALVLQKVSVGLRQHFRHVATSGIEQVEHVTLMNDLQARELYVNKLEELVQALRQEKERRAAQYTVNNR